MAEQMSGWPQKTFDWAGPFDVYRGWLARFNVQPDANQ